jgi:hypothetical protein
MRYDFNVLEKRAEELMKSGRPNDAIRIYFLMADGDQSLDGGYLGQRIAECYESMGHLYAAKYWYGRAAEENPIVRTACVDARKRLDSLVNVDDLVPPHLYQCK